MSYKRIAIDFNQGEKCEFCPRTLSSFTGVLMQEIGTGRKLWAGTTCAKKHSMNPDEKIPNLVKASYEAEPKDDEDESSSKSRKAANNPVDSPTEEEAISYLVLRQEKLKHIPGINYSGLEELYKRYETGSLTDENILYLKRLIVKNNKDNKELSLHWLRNLYACEASLQRCLRKKPDSEFFKSLQSQLHSKKSLSEKQIIKMNEELERIGFKHKVSPNAFN
ncbi:MAG: hypothetical protein U0V72_00105 [Cytophagales bacterium]